MTETESPQGTQPGVPLDAVVDAMEEAAAVLDAAGRVQRANRCLTRLVGLSEDELRGRPLASFLHPDDAGPWREALAAPPPPSGARLDLRLCGVGGRGIALAVTLVPLGLGRRRAALVIASDRAAREARARRLEQAVSDLEERRAQLELQVATDAVTGAYSPGAVDEVLEQELRRSRRTATAASVILVDIDNFKSVNDTRGHAFGNVVLREFCQRCQQAVRATDYVVRYGGDEFAIILPLTDALGARAVAERILAAVRSAPFGGGHRQVPVTISVGIGSTAAGEELGADALIHRADQALYLVKEKGRDGIASWEEAGGTDR